MRKSWLYYADKKERTYPVPELTLLADKHGFIWLSKFFAMCAKKNPSYAPGMGGDIEDHEHLWRGWPFDAKLSDEMQIRLGIINTRNKKEVFEKYDITTHPPYTGDLRKQYKEQIKRLMRNWKRMLEMEREAERGFIKTPQQLRRAIARLSPYSPITEKFTVQWAKLGSKCGQLPPKKPWWKTQQEHWLGWLKGWNGPGYYGRKDWNHSAEFVYNHIVNPGMLIYLIEGAKVHENHIRKAIRTALANASSMASMSSAIRRIIPWWIVEHNLLLLRHRK